MTNDLKALAASAHNKPLYAHAAVAPELLECFENPILATHNRNTCLWEHIKVAEFTCLCPITGQPDFATIEIYYRPKNLCVESKALKLYLGSYRNIGSFHEAVASRVLTDLVELLTPTWMLVIGRFTPRGGIPFQPRAWIGEVPEQLLYRE